MTVADSSFVEGSVSIPPLFSVVKKVVSPNESFVKKSPSSVNLQCVKKDLRRMH